MIRLERIRRGQKRPSGAPLEAAAAVLRQPPDVEDTPWGGYFAYDGEQAVGTCAFKNAPAPGRPPEIAYHTFPAFERRGHGTAMARALLAIAAEHRVPRVVAESLPEANASTRVLERAGFHRAGEGVDDEVGRTWRWGFTLRTLLMGVVNVTPDSFSDGGLFIDPEAAIAQGRTLAAAGADILDVGGESTRPGAAPVSEAEELARVLPVIRGLRGLGVSLSIDTSKPAVAAAALEAGATFVNDVTGLRDSDALAQLAAKAGAQLCVMHMKGPPSAMRRDPTRGDDVGYDDLFGEVVASLKASVERARAAGVPRDALWVDPGIGFGKTFDHNLSLLKHLGRLRELGQPVLVGCSRKGFLGQLTGGKPPAARDVATAATVAITAAQGTADMVRVHSVSEAKDAAAVGDAVRRAL